MRWFGLSESRRGISLSFSLILVLALTLALSACSVNSIQAQLLYSFSPESAVAHRYLSNRGNVEAFHMLGTRKTPDGKMGSVYTFSRSGDYGVGYAVSEKIDPFQWMVIVTNDYESPLPPKKTMPVDYQVYQDGYTALFGPVFSKDVVSVEADFSDGEAVQDLVAGGFFLLFSSRKTDVCSMKVVGSGNQVLFQKTFSKRFMESDECP